MKAGKLRSLVVLLASAEATLRITLATLWDVHRGTYVRANGDRRLRWWSRRLLDLAEVRVEVFNPTNVRIERGKPLVVMSNHASLYDIPLIFVALPGSIRMLTKKELFGVPVWGRAMAAAEFVSIDRQDHDHAIHDLDAAREKMAEGIALWIAPEGTRSKDGKLGVFKKGGFMLALQTGAMIIPVGIRGAHEILPPKTFLDLQTEQTAEVHVGEPIDASSYTLETREQLMEEVARRIHRLADL